MRSPSHLHGRKNKGTCQMHVPEDSDELSGMHFQPPLKCLKGLFKHTK